VVVILKPALVLADDLVVWTEEADDVSRHDDIFALDSSRIFPKTSISTRTIIP
jgi:hypothetical protein